MHGKPRSSARHLRRVILMMSWFDHRSPGRFFATLEMKAIMALILTNYDVKFTEGFSPKETWIGPSRIPDRQAQVMFKRRLRRKHGATTI